VEFDRQDQIKNSLDRRAELQDLEQQIRKREAQESAAAAKDDSEIKVAESSVTRAELEMVKNDMIPKINAEKNTLALEQAQATNAITVPQQAVTRTQQGDTLTVVGADGKLSKRTVKISAAQNNQWVVLDGLKAGEQVMVDGFQKLQMMPPGTPVKAVPWTGPQGAAAPAAAASAAAAPAAAAE